VASMRAWRFVPVPDIRTNILGMSSDDIAVGRIASASPLAIQLSLDKFLAIRIFAELALTQSQCRDTFCKAHAIFLLRIPVTK
jgi:hypothetical protein